MAKILVVDDEQDILDVVVYALEADGFTVSFAMDGDTALAAVQREPPDLVVLDLTMPGLSGLDLFRAMRAAVPALPVIMLTSRSAEIDRILGLELGADDYVTKPFSIRELQIRVRNMLRRVTGGPGARPESSHTLTFGPLTLDADSYSVMANGRRTQLTKGEFQILEELMRHPSRVFSRDVLIGRLYGPGHPVTDRSVDAYIKRLRQKVRELELPCDPITTRHGVGYRMNTQLESLPAIPGESL